MDYLDLDLVSNIVDNFQNPSSIDEKTAEEPDSADVSDGKDFFLKRKGR